MAKPRNDNVREIILKGTERMLEKKALADISLAEIAREAGISKGTLYYYFKNKDEIIFTITDKYLSEQWDDLIKWTEDSRKDTSLNRLIGYILQRDIAAVGTRMHLIYAAMLGNEHTRKKLIERYAQFNRLIAEKIGERTDRLPADYLAWLVLLVSDGLIIQQTLKNKGLDIDGFIRQSAEFIKRLNASDHGGPGGEKL